jgi:tellurite methyltransferase
MGGESLTSPSDLLSRWAGSAPHSRALVFGAGGGSEAAWLAHEGFKVDAVEKDRLRGQRLKDACAGLKVSVWTTTIEAFQIEPAAYGLIVALAVLHFVTPPHLPGLAKAVVQGLAPGGLLVVQVLTDDDPSAGVRRSQAAPEPFPNTFQLDDGQGLTHYFAPGELVTLFRRLDPVEHETYRFAAAGRLEGFGSGESLVARRAAAD